MSALRCGRHVVPAAHDNLMPEHGLITERWRLKFPNGYEASIFRGMASFGSYELAVCLVGGGIVYDTGVTDDVERRETADELEPLLDAIEVLPPREAREP